MTFADPSRVIRAFEHLFACGARNVSVGGGNLWLTASQSEKSFSGAGDATLVISGAADSFHVVLAGVTCSGSSIPDLGVFVDPDSLTLDYRMGSSWGEPEIQSLLALLRQLMDLGGVVTIPWWGADGERTFLGALGGA
ncbi:MULTISPECIES: hypothetical protein [unclassified Pseudoxanthomonas]|uniref:hypothetical protein n=1 Tax=unclassified Pseudoxanthomonas TaxID=2645906 RepID=UPI0030780E7D